MLKNTLLDFIKDHYDIFLLIAVLIFGFFIRNYNFNFLVEADDNYRDYLVTRHIIRYQEYPLLGPWSTSVNLFINNPVYYYLLSIFLLIKDDFLFLGFVSILFYLLTIFVIYLLGKEIFNKNVGLMASLLYSLMFIQFTDKQTSFIWQPWTIPPFIYLSFLLLLKYSRGKDFPLLLLSIVIFIFSATLYTSVFSLAPLFFLSIFIILRRQKNTIFQFLLLGLCTLFAFLFFYFPVLMYYSKFPSSDSVYNLSQRVSLSDFNNNFVSNSSTLVNIFLLKEGMSFIQPKILISGMIIVLLLSLLYFKKNPRYFLLSSFILQPLIFSSAIKLNSPYDIGRYFTPCLGLLFILITGLLNNLFSKNVFAYLVKILIFIIIIKIIYPSTIPSANKPRLAEAISIISAANQTIENEVRNIQKTENKNMINFFDLKVYRRDEEFSSALFWAFLEKDLDNKFTTVSNSSSRGFEVISGDDYIFLVCFKYIDDNSLNQCRNNFSRQYYNYFIRKEIFNQNPFVIYVSKKGFLPSI